MSSSDLNKLAIMAIEAAELNKQGILGFHPHGYDNHPSVELGGGVLRKLFPGEKAYRDDSYRDYTCFYIDYMGVRFFELIPYEEDFYEEDNETEV